MAEKHECSRVEIEPAENGGFSVRKFYRNKPEKGDKHAVSTGYVEPKTYAFSTLDELSTFLHDSFCADKRGRVVASQG